jgi:serine/threonine protein kinase
MRFEHEARVLASLNHPNIAAIHGIEESGGRKFLVMDLYPEKRWPSGSGVVRFRWKSHWELPRKITEALEAAHEKGVIHRDLKPANIKVTPEGKVKVAGFWFGKGHESECKRGSAQPSPW